MREKKYRLRNGVVVVPEIELGWVRVVDTQNAVFTDSSSACCTARELSKFWAVGARNALRPCTADPLSWKGFAWGEQFDVISDALGLDDCEHPALRAREVVQRLQSSPAPVAGGVPQPETFQREDRYIVLKRSDLERHATPSQLRELERTCEMVRAGRLNEGKRIDHYVVVADDWPEYEETWEKIQARVEGRASRLPAIKPGEVVVAMPDPTGIVVDLPERYRERGIELVRNAIQWAREHARIVPRAQATTTEKESRR